MEQGRVVTTDLKVVRVLPVARDMDNDFQSVCLFVDSEGILYVSTSLRQLLPNEKRIITQCWDESISDEDLLNSVKKLIEEFTNS